MKRYTEIVGARLYQYPNIKKIVRTESDPLKWEVELTVGTVVVTSDQLWSGWKFNLLVMEKLGKVFDLMPQADWLDELRMHIEK